MKTVRMFGLVIVAMFLATGCFSYSTLHTATPTEEGSAKIKGSTGAFRMDFGSVSPNQGGGSQRLSGTLPTFEFHGRYGLGNNMDIGGKIYPIGAGLDFNYAFLNDSNIAVSVNPAVNFLTLGGGGSAGIFGTAMLNVLADVVKTDMFTLTVGAKPGTIYAAGGGGSTAAPFVGGTAGATLMLGDNFGLQPWFDGIYETRGGTFWWTALLGFTFEV